MLREIGEIREVREVREVREFREYSESVGRIYYFLPIFLKLLNFLNLPKFSIPPIPHKITLSFALFKNIYYFCRIRFDRVITTK